VARVLSTAFCVALLAATAVAFALTEGAKTELSPIYGTAGITKVFSPTCNLSQCRTNQASIAFSLRKRQHIQVWIVDSNGHRVATIVSGKTFPKGRVSLAWSGVGEDGVTILPNGTYQPVIRLSGRTITLPNPITLDTVAPRVVSYSPRGFTHISPDNDHRNDVLVVHYKLSEPAHGVLLVDGRQAVFTRSHKIHGTMTWNGKVAGALQPPGKYLLTIAAQDTAGNRSKPLPFIVVEIRYLALGRTSIAVAPSRRFAVFVLTDATEISWLFDRGRGTQRSHTLRLRAPRRPGTYQLFVTANGHTARATVTVG
jgi:hypothetical protein